MLSERKKYNYNVAPNTQASRSNRLPTSAYKPNSSNAVYCSNENINIDHIEDVVPASVPQSKRIIQLEAANKKMLEETTRQFQKFQADVVKVEGILRIKEQTVDRLEEENRMLIQDKTALIQALRQKQAIIQQFHTKLNQLLTRQQTPPTPTTCTTTQTHHPPTPTSSSQCQTEPQPPTQTQTQTQTQTSIVELEQTIQRLTQTEQQLSIEQIKNRSINEEVYKLKQQLYEVSSELGLVKQQFQTYKLLHEIQEVRKL